MDRPARRTALISQKLTRYDVDIVTLSKIRLTGESSLSENIGVGYTFYWRALSQEERRIHGFGFAIKNSLLKSLHSIPVGMSERLMKLRLQLSNNRFATIFS